MRLENFSNRKTRIKKKIKKEKQGVVTLHSGSIIYNLTILLDFAVNSIYTVLTTNTVYQVSKFKDGLGTANTQDLVAEQLSFNSYVNVKVKNTVVKRCE